MASGHPELDWAEEGDDDVDRVARRRRRLVGTVALIVLVAMVAPSIAGLVTSTHANAALACELYRIQRTPDASSEVAFELFAAGGSGWQCYTVGATGGRHYLGSLGWFPGVPDDLVPAQNS